MAKVAPTLERSHDMIFASGLSERFPPGGLSPRPGTFSIKNTSSLEFCRCVCSSTHSRVERNVLLLASSNTSLSPCLENGWQLGPAATISALGSPVRSTSGGGQTQPPKSNPTPNQTRT
eukprot:4685297-Pyramimonas_sp.AAC.1